MRGTWQSESDMGGALAVLASLAVGAGVIWLLIEFLWLIAVIAGLAVLVSGAILWWMFRHGADVATVSRPPLPPPDARALPSRPAEAVEGPQLHIHLHGTTPEQAAEGIAAIREAGYRAYDTYRRDQ